MMEALGSEMKYDHLKGSVVAFSLFLPHHQQF
jgi:hypothetical protein